MGGGAGIIPSSLCLLQLHQPQANRKENQAPISLQTGFHPQHLHVTVARRETTSEDPDAGHLKRQSRPLNHLTACAVRDKLAAARNDLVIVH